MYNSPKVAAFYKYVTDNFECREEDVRKMFLEEYDTRLRESRAIKTWLNKQIIIDGILENCYQWLDDDRKEKIDHIDLVFYRVAPLFFRSIKRKA